MGKKLTRRQQRAIAAVLESQQKQLKKSSILIWTTSNIGYFKCLFRTVSLSLKTWESFIFGKPRPTPFARRRIKRNRGPPIDSRRVRLYQVLLECSKIGYSTYWKMGGSRVVGSSGLAWDLCLPVLASPSSTLRPPSQKLSPITKHECSRSIRRM